MTYLELVEKEHRVSNVAVSSCPSDYGLKDSERCPFYGGWSSCEECWNRELESYDALWGEEEWEE